VSQVVGDHKIENNMTIRPYINQDGKIKDVVISTS